MHLAHPNMFHLLWLAFAAALFLWWACRRRKAMMEKFAEAELLSHIAADFSWAKQSAKGTLIVLVFIFSVLALARPQWGYEWQEVKRQGLDILVAIDTSKSMLTSDVKPNRLERTKLAVKDLVKKLKGDRIGLVAFAGDAFLTCPLTVDYGGFLLSLEDLNVNTIPRGGTALGQAIAEALKGFENVSGKYKALIILTDGENLEGDPLKIAAQAHSKGIKIFCVGIGTKEGELIQVQNEEGGKEFLKDREGNFVKSRLNELLLESIALATQGAYVRSSGAQFGLDLIYERELSKMEKREIEGKMEKKFHERFQYPLAIAAILLMLETCLSTRKRRE